MDLQLVQYNRIFLEKSWDWLHDKEIKELTMTSEFSREEQLLWYQSLDKKKNYYIWGITCDNVPIGCCGIKNVLNKHGEYWCYIGEKQYWGLGIGKWILENIKQEAIALGLDQLEINVWVYNIKSIHLHKTRGFIEKKIDGEMVNMYCNIKNSYAGDRICM